MGQQIVSGTTRYVKYFIAQRKKGKTISLEDFADSKDTMESSYDDNTQLKEQADAVDKYINSKSTEVELIGSYTDYLDNHRTSQWPNLKQALKSCVETNAALIIGELGTFSSNETFAKLLLDSNVEFYCCDQPFVDKNILDVLYKHYAYRKKVHGRLIRDGLERTSNKSGNPNAAEVISKVNKPKIHTAIIFADLISPIISDYSAKGYSQRQMVKMLNDENFTAPEGGKWVLSQLQKVLDRVKLNDVAKDAGPTYKELKQQDWDNAKIAEEFNTRGISSFKRGPWDEVQVTKLEERLNQLDEIDLINNFATNLLKVIKNAKTQGKTALDLMRDFEENNVTIRQKTIETSA